MMLSTRELRTTVPSHSLHTHACIRHMVNSICASSPSAPVSDLLRSERHRDRELFIPAFQCPRRMQRIGTLGDGGKWVCSFGLFSFVLPPFSPPIPRSGLTWVLLFSLCHRHQLRVSVRIDTVEARTGIWGQDYSVDSWGPEITGDPELSPSRSAGRTTTTTTTPSTSCSTGSPIGISGHMFIEILKIDIEGGEFDAPTAFCSARAAEGNARPIGQLQLEIHAREGRENFENFARWWTAGLRPFWTESDLVYINIVRGARPELSEACSFVSWLETCR
ncbi:hypothetical protein EDB92DRAFT_2092794 [Lactarius akahatsu]|uniref:Methyltransferase FkbM domain-containing protein n=1 Tax=Lactarius akahatsu TaxID=416441 RepID=A0AAD4L7X6_9AGAM|nr:hypothetical protein EDB92DRAFT_2092794 [Lactarius akahatsu]